jgi:GAF domain-containing protein
VDHLEMVRVVAERLADSRDLGDVLGALDSASREMLGAGAVSLGLIEQAEGSMTTLMATGFAEGTQLLLSQPVVLEDDVPATEVWRTGKPIYWSSLEERDRDYPRYAGVASDYESWAVLPLVVNGTVTGILSLGWEGGRPFDEVDSALLGVIAQQSAVAVDRARLQEAERAERETLELLSEGTQLMVSALDPDVIVRRLVRLAVPRLAPWCAMYVAEPDGLRRVAIDIQGDPELAAHLQRQRPIPIDAPSPVAECFRKRQTIVVPEVSEQLVRNVYQDDSAKIPAAEGRMWTGLVVPVWAAGNVVGVMSLVSSTWRGSPPREVRFAAEGLAGRAGTALFNARRFERERLTAALLTQALLPGDVPAIDGYEVAARYRPWGGAVAGDWYDVTHLPSGEYLIGIGDAAGHGLRAASLMAQLRNAARGSAFAGSGPAELLNGLGLLAMEDDPENLATAIYALLDGPAGDLRWASAGHIPPLLARHDSVTYLDGAGRPPLGCPVDHLPAEHVTHLEPGETLVLVTDGILEQRGEDLNDRFASLRVKLAEHWTEPVASIAEHIMAELCQPPDDDCCLVVLRRL